MKKSTLTAFALAAATCAGIAQADPFALKPGQYEINAVSAEGGHDAVTDSDCISPDEAKDVVKYIQDQGSEETCKLTKSKFAGKHYSGESVCKGGDAMPFKSMDVKTELTFSDTGYGGTAVQKGMGNDGKPFEKTLKISAKRTGECK